MKARTPLHVTATGTRIMASKGKVAFLTAAVARYIHIVHVTAATQELVNKEIN